MEDGTQLGVMETRDAQQRADDMGLDLVEVSPNVRPPVCKIVDYGQFKYDEKKRKNEAKKKQSKVELKQIKLRPKTDTHDIESRGHLEPARVIGHNRPGRAAADAGAGHGVERSLAV